MTRSLGYTLPELIITLFLLALLAGISLPDLSRYMDQRKGDITVRRLAQAVEFARVAAISSGGLVTLCRSRDGMVCGGEWREGVLIFTDRNGNRLVDQDDSILRHMTFPGSDGRIQWRAFRNRQYLQITKLGFTRFQNGNFTYCPAGGDPRMAHQIIVNRTARVRFAQDSDGDGIREDSRGRAIDCS